MADIQRIEDLETRRFILDGLSKSYGLTQKREGVHLSSLIYCLTKAFLDQNQTMGCTDEEVLLFSTGFGLEEVLIPKLFGVECPLYFKDGISYRPDFVLHAEEGIDSDKPSIMPYEIKSTRKGMKSYMGTIPEMWVIYQLAGCKIMEVNEYRLVGLLVSERPVPQLICETIIYEQGDIESNWEYILGRRDVYVEAMRSLKAPTPGKYCNDWECKNCRYSIVCDAIAAYSQE